jgi:hypothetical protein
MQSFGLYNVYLIAPAPTGAIFIKKLSKAIKKYRKQQFFSCFIEYFTSCVII